MSAQTDTIASGDAPTRRPRISKAWRRRLVFLVPLTGYLVLVLFGVTNSNIGVDRLRADPSHPLGFQIGQSEAIRSDEYNTESALWLGRIAAGPDRPVDPLSASPDFFSQLPDGPVSSVVFFDGTLLELGPWLPDAWLFAMKWWLPTLLLAIGMPIWFRQVTGSMRWGYLGAVLVFAAPSSMWWSGRPVNTLGFMFAACALAIYAADEFDRGRRWRALLWVVLAGILFARFPTYYQPLAIVIGTPVAIATVGYLLARPRPWRNRLVAVGAFAVSAGAWTAALMWENLPAIKAGLDTVYPGERRSTSESLVFGRVFGATNLGWLKSIGITTAYTNQTEIASSFTVLLLVLAVLIAARRWRGTRELAAAFWPVMILGVFWLSWCTVSWGALGSALPIINRVPGFRGAHSTGFVATIAFCLFMSQWRPSRRWSVPAVAAGVTAFVSAYAGSSLQQGFLPALTDRMIWLAALVSAAIVFALVRWPQRWEPLVAAGAGALLLTFSVNPILFGLGDLRDSDGARLLLAQAPRDRHDDVLWASNSSYVDALFFATGTPALSSRQQIGPDPTEWEKLDPGRAHEDFWNRGGTYLTFEWDNDTDIQWSLPSPDIVVMTTSPCTVKQRIPELGFVVSTKQLSDSCLAPVDEFSWSGQEQFVYAVS